MPDPADREHMRAALALAARGLGNAWPNPSVGCVLVAPDGHVVGRGWTQPGGRPHAETEAVRRAGEAARGATAYVTLEPCSHWGRTGPCCDALAAAGIARAVVATRDPDPRVDGEGLRRLAAAGVAVEEGLLGEEARALNEGFLKRVARGLPMVTLKLATTLDGRIATRAGESRWITSPEARRRAHALRGCHDAVLVGSGTVLADDPDLTCRLPGYAPATPGQPLRVVADARLRTPPEARLLNGTGGPVIVATRPGHGSAALDAIRARGAEVVEVAPDRDGDGSGLDPEDLLRSLAARGVTRVLCEGGAALAASLLRAPGGLVDRLAWFHAPAVMGGDGLPAALPLPVDSLARMPKFRRVAAATPSGPDLLSEFERATAVAATAAVAA